MSDIKAEEIRKALDKMDVSSARQRNKVHGRAICLEPTADEVETQVKSRAECYIKLSRELAEIVHGARAGLSDEELEAVEFVREALLERAKSNYVSLVR